MPSIDTLGASDVTDNDDSDGGCKGGSGGGAGPGVAIGVDQDWSPYIHILSDRPPSLLCLKRVVIAAQFSLFCSRERSQAEKG